MGRARRKIVSKQCYEVCFRAKEGLPLVAYHVINLIIGSVIARAQRDNKVILCHDIWNGSHAHLFLVALDAKKFTEFLSEVQKQLTEMIKRLLGMEYMNIWEGEPMIAEVLDIEKAIDRISYIYANPGQDNLVDVIEKFPGFSSWRDFKNAGNTINAERNEIFPWIHQPSVPQLESPVLLREDDLYLVRMLKRVNKEQHTLTRQPNIWMKCFDITTEEQVAKVNREIEKGVRDREEVARKKRKAEGKAVMGVERLTSQPIMKPHKPKKKDRKIFCLTSINELRMAFIAEFKTFCEECRYCFERWQVGDMTVEWPPGAFRPPLRPAYNVLRAPSAGHFEYL